MAARVLLGSELSAKIYGPQDETYQESLKSYWSLQEAEIVPTAVFKPETVTDVAEALRHLRRANLESNFDAKFAIRAGGHQAFPGSANIDAGLTIDLRNLKRLNVSEDRSTVTTQSGNTFEDVYKYLETINLCVPGARVAQVGVSGFVLGGGLSWYSPKSGFVCDNVTDFEIVLADGSVAHANQSENADLWKALKGGGNNFGIVTAITMKTIPASTLWGGNVISDPSAYPASVKKLHQAITSPDIDLNAAIMNGIADIKGFQMTYHSLKYTAPQENPPVLKDFVDLGSLQNTLRHESLSELAIEEGKYSLGGFRRMYMTCSFKSNVQMLTDCEKFWRDTKDSIQNLEGLEWSIIFNPVLPSCIEAGAARGGNSLGMSTADGPLIIVLLVGSWSNKSDDEAGEAAGRNFIDKVMSRSKELGCYHSFVYMNYAWKDQPVIAGYGVESVKFLRNVSRKYDPDQIFQKAVPGGFKIPSGP